MKKGLFDDGKPPTPPLTEEKLAELRKNTQHMTLEDLGTVQPDADPVFVQTLREYLDEFAKPPTEKGMPCINCGYPIIQDMMHQLLGSRGGFEWGYVHGHGFCKECTYPIVMHHFIKDKNGKDILTIQFVPMQVHPDKISLPPKKEKKEPL